MIAKESADYASYAKAGPDSRFPNAKGGVLWAKKSVLKSVSEEKRFA